MSLTFSIGMHSDILQSPTLLCSQPISSSLLPTYLLLSTEYYLLIHRVWNSQKIRASSIYCHKNKSFIIIKTNPFLKFLLFKGLSCCFSSQKPVPLFLLRDFILSTPLPVYTSLSLKGP